MNDQRFEEFLRRAARGYHRPPDTPREAIWRRIEAARAVKTARPRRPGSWLRWAAGVAAVLAVGLGLGVGIGRRLGPEGRAGAVEAAAEAMAFRAAAADYLSRTDAFFTLFRAEAGTGRPNADVSVWARDLLSTARLMLDSPVADDPHLRQLLEDLELVLAQIVLYSPEQEADALRFIEEGIDARGVLLRMRAMLAATTAVPEEGAF